MVLPEAQGGGGDALVALLICSSSACRYVHFEAGAIGHRLYLAAQAFRAGGDRHRCVLRRRGAPVSLNLAPKQGPAVYLIHFTARFRSCHCPDKFAAMRFCGGVNGVSQSNPRGGSFTNGVCVVGSDLRFARNLNVL